LLVLREVKKACPNILMILAGEGPARRDLMAMTANMGLATNVVFVGNLSRGSTLNDCYAAGDVFVFSSRTETQGLVLLEAMTLGTPVVSTAVMGTRDVLVDGCGCMVANENVKDFARKINWLLEHPVERGLLADSGAVYARQWEASIMAERMTRLYARVAAQDGSAVGEVVYEKG
jgi:glycosyltransferase involved in cell wall biosynthesis